MMALIPLSQCAATPDLTLKKDKQLKDEDGLGIWVENFHWKWKIWSKRRQWGGKLGHHLQPFCQRKGSYLFKLLGDWFLNSRRGKMWTYLETTSNFSSKSAFLFSSWSSWACNNHRRHHHHHAIVIIIISNHGIHQYGHLHKFGLALEKVCSLPLVQLPHLKFRTLCKTRYNQVLHLIHNTMSWNQIPAPASPQEWQAVVQASPPLHHLLHHLPLLHPGNSPGTPLKQPGHRNIYTLGLLTKLEFE